jgi:hypothetical protein
LLLNPVAVSLGGVPTKGAGGVVALALAEYSEFAADVNARMR